MGSLVGTVCTVQSADQSSFLPSVSEGAGATVELEPQHIPQRREETRAGEKATIDNPHLVF